MNEHIEKKLESDPAAGKGGLRTVLPAAALCAVLACVAYLGVLRHEFVYDDYKLVLGNEAIRTLTPGSIVDFFTRRDYVNFLPMRMLSYAIDYRIWEYNPVGYHITNIVLHGLNSALVVLLGYVIFAAGGMKPAAARAAAMVAGALFAVHPLHVEAVTWISGRKEVLYSFFFLVGLLLHARRRIGQGRVGPAGFAAVLLCMLAAQFSKGTAVAFPFAAVAFDFLLARRADGKRIRWWEHGVLFAVTAAVVVMNMRLASEDNVYFGYFGGTLATHVLTSLKIIPFYLSKALWPAGLSVEYGAPVSSSLADPAVVASVVVLAAYAGAAIYTWKRFSAAAFGLLFFVLALGPVLNIVPFGVFAADRYAYLPLLGLCLAAGGAAGLVSDKVESQRVLLSAVGAALVLALGFATYVRNSDWQSEITLWYSAVAAAPDAPKAHDGLGRAYMDAKKFADAEPHLLKAVELDPQYTNAYVNLAITYIRTGQLERAKEITEQGLRHNPGDISLLYNRSACCLSMGDFQCALRALAPVGKMDPDYLMTRRMMPIIIEKLKETAPPGEFEKIMRESGF